MTGQLALASLRHRPLRTALTALGIAVAIASTVVFMSIGEGLRKAFADQLAGLGPELQVSYGEAGDDLFPTAPDLPDEYVERLTQDAESLGLASVTPVLTWLRGGLSVSQSFIFEGLPTDVPLDRVFTGASLVEGRLLTPEDEGSLLAVVGQSVADRAGLEIGDTLRLNPEAKFEIVGVASSGSGLLDNMIIVPFTSLRTAMGVVDRVTAILLKLERPERADLVAAQVEAAYPELGVQTQAGALSVVQDSLRISDFVRLGISLIALVVGAIAVANTMMMSVFERTREFGVVRAVGAKPSFLFSLVVLESVLLSLVGAAAGVGLGTLAAGLVNYVANDYLGLSLAAVTPRLVAFAVAVAAVTGLLAGLLPAGRAARVPIAVAVARE
ncbi:MAG TPA: ABC transporter permease [Trueperaceae bacterium]